MTDSEILHRRTYEDRQTPELPNSPLERDIWSVIEKNGSSKALDHNRGKNRRPIKGGAEILVAARRKKPKTTPWCLKKSVRRGHPAAGKRRKERFCRKLGKKDLPGREKNVVAFLALHVHGQEDTC